VASLDFVELLRYPPRNTSIRYEFSSPM